jgi:3-dehydroquinate synthase
VKYGLIDDFAFLRMVRGQCPARARRRSRRAHACHRPFGRAKARIVAEDERETTGKRALLNLGHTFGHALEAETGFSDRLLHGEAVAPAWRSPSVLGRAGLCSEEDAGRIGFHLARSGLPTTLAEAHAEAPGARLVEHMAHDKKMEGGKLPFLLARGIGQTFLAKDVSLADVERFLDGER